MNRILFTYLIVACAFLSASAQEFKKTGTSGFTFLNIPVTARAAALGETSISLTDGGVSGVFINPAILGFMQSNASAVFSYAPWFVETTHYAAGAAYNAGFGVFAIGAVVMDYGTFDRTVKVAGQRQFLPLGTFTAQGSALSLAFSQRLTDRFSFGIAAKYVSERIDVYSADNVVIDGGVLYDTGFKTLRIAAALHNFGTDTKFRNDPFKMPSSVRLGVSGELYTSADLGMKVTGLAEALHPNDADEHLNVGLEIGMFDFLQLRGGYKFFYDEESFTAGVGLRSGAASRYGFDVAYGDYGRLGSVIRLSLEAGL